jgi:hypothetical protein
MLVKVQAMILEATNNYNRLNTSTSAASYSTNAHNQSNAQQFDASLTSALEEAITQPLLNYDLTPVEQSLSSKTTESKIRSRLKSRPQSTTAKQLITSSQNYAYSCDKCELKFTQTSSLQRHKQTVHENLRKST